MAEQGVRPITDDTIRQHGNEVLDFSSQYGREYSISYTMQNITGDCKVYPNYGDFTQAGVFRTYGPWWNTAPSAVSHHARRPSSFISQDFVEIHFQQMVHPRTIHIYETYKPGAVVRILACDVVPLDILYNQSGNPRWFVLWEGSPQVVDDLSRDFTPTIRQDCPFLTSLIRLEFNHQHLDYYTEIDAVTLIGPTSSSVDGPEIYQFMDIIEENIEENIEANDERNVETNVENVQTNVENDEANGQSIEATRICENRQSIAPMESCNNGQSTAVIEYSENNKSIEAQCTNTMISCTGGYSNSNAVNSKCISSDTNNTLNNIPSDALPVCEKMSVADNIANFYDGILNKNVQNSNSHCRNGAEKGCCTGGVRNCEEVEISDEISSVYNSVIKYSSAVVNCDTTNGHFDRLPSEVIQLILSFLDLVTLCRLSSVSRLFHHHCYDPVQYMDTDLQPYWHKVDDSALLGLRTRCSITQSVILSWCGGYGLISSSVTNRFLSVCSESLTCLKLSCCKFVDNSTIILVTSTCLMLKELDLHCCRTVTGLTFSHISSLFRLENLNLYRTNCDNTSILAITSSCRRLKYLNLGACNAIVDTDEVVTSIANNCSVKLLPSCRVTVNSYLRQEGLPALKACHLASLSTTFFVDMLGEALLLPATGNNGDKKVHLISLDLWRAKSFTDVGLSALANGCPYIEELDLGWCSDIRSTTGCLVEFAKSCPRLRKLFLTANRSVCDDDLDAISQFCVNLEQLDILGTREVHKPAMQRVLECCNKLRLFDVSFCEAADKETVHQWRLSYPKCSIKRSYQADSSLVYL